MLHHYLIRNDKYKQVKCIEELNTIISKVNSRL